MPRSPNAVTAIIHLHRAEVARLTTYRVRLDTTTSWAVTSSALVTTFALANPQIPHVAFLFLGFIVFYFLSLEARRFRAYEASRHRVHLIERSFYREVLGGQVDPKWTDQLLEAVEQPGITVNRLGALGWRLRRNYLWIITAVLVTWLGKLYLTGESPQFTGGPGGARGDRRHSWLAGHGRCGGVLPGAAGDRYCARRIYPLGDDEARQLMEHVSEE